MTAVTTFDGIISRISNGYSSIEPFYWESQTARASNIATTSGSRVGWIMAIPNPLPTGVTSYHLSKIVSYSSGIFTFKVAKAVLLGTLTATGSSPGTFSAGSTMPSATTLGTASYQTNGEIWSEVTTALSGTLGTLSVTFTDQGGTSRTVTSTPSTGAVVTSAGFSFFASGTTVTGQGNAVTAMSWSGASPTGVIKIYGLIDLYNSQSKTNVAPGVGNNITHYFNNYPLAAGDVLALIGVGYTTAAAMTGWLEFWGDS